MSHPPWYLPAAIALHHARRDEVEEAVKTIEGLLDAQGAEVIVPVMLAWIDTSIGIMKPPADIGDRMVELSFIEITEGGVTTGADAVPAPIAWAGRLLAARIADDKEMFMDLVKSVSDDDMGEWILTLLHVCAMNINQRAE